MSSYRMKYKIGATQYHIPVVDDMAGFGGGIPLGTILPYSANTLNPPEGFLFCDGSAISRAMYPDLFALIGTLYGSGDGSTTFNLPNLTGGKFLEGTGSAGTSKSAGLPNIEAGTETYGLAAIASGTTKGTGAANLSSSVTGYGFPQSGAYTSTKYWTFDASLSNPIYGNSETVQPSSVTVRYIIKVFDSAGSSASINLSAYASDLATRMQRQQIPAFNQRVVITTSGNFVAPVTGWYKFTIKGAGGGGAGGKQATNPSVPGGGGGEGGTTFAYEKMLVGETAIITIGAGGTGGAATYDGISGGDSSVVVNENTYTAGGGQGGGNGNGDNVYIGGYGGTGSIYGCPGNPGPRGYGGTSNLGGAGGGAGGGTVRTREVAAPAFANSGAGGAGGAASNGSGNNWPGGNGADGFCWVEYFDPTL